MIKNYLDHQFLAFFLFLFQKKDQNFLRHKSLMIVDDFGGRDLEILFLLSSQKHIQGTSMSKIYLHLHFFQGSPIFGFFTDSLGPHVFNIELEDITVGSSNSFLLESSI